MNVHTCPGTHLAREPLSLTYGLLGDPQRVSMWEGVGVHRSGPMHRPAHVPIAHPLVPRKFFPKKGRFFMRFVVVVAGVFALLACTTLEDQAVSDCMKYGLVPGSLALAQCAQAEAASRRSAAMAGLYAVTQQQRQQRGW